MKYNTINKYPKHTTTEAEQIHNKNISAILQRLNKPKQRVKTLGHVYNTVLNTTEPFILLNVYESVEGGQSE